MKMTRLIRLGGILNIVMAVLLCVFSVVQYKQIHDTLAEMPVLNGEAELRAAMAQPTQVYLLTDMVIGGEGVTDALGILEKPEDYLYIGYRQEKMEREKGDTSDREWNYKSSGSSTVYSRQLNLYGDIPLTNSKGYRFEGSSSAIADTELQSAFRLKLRQGKYYYPDGVSSKTGTIRYRIEVIRKGERVCMKAEAGDGRVQPLPIGSSETPAVVIGGEHEDLVRAFRADTKGIGMLAAIFFALGIVMYGIGKGWFERAKSK